MKWRRKSNPQPEVEAEEPIICGELQVRIKIADSVGEFSTDLYGQVRVLGDTVESVAYGLDMDSVRLYAANDLRLLANFLESDQCKLGR